MNYAIDIQGINKTYSGFSLEHLDFQVPEGCVVGLIGENGAGKTTLIKAALGLVKIDSGDVKLLGHSVAEEDDVRYKEEIGVVFDNNSTPEELKLPQVKKLMSKIYTKWDNEKFDSLAERFGLPANKKIKDFSKGMKMKLNIAIALAHDPKLLVLDEATGGLDPIVRDEILDLFLEFMQEEDHSILISSHITSDIEKIADYIAFIKDGRIVFCKNKDDLLYDHGIVKCKEKDLEYLDTAFFIAERRNAFQNEILIRNKQAFVKRYPDVIVDPASVEDIMLFYVKGELL